MFLGPCTVLRALAFVPGLQVWPYLSGNAAPHEHARIKL